MMREGRSQIKKEAKDNIEKFIGSLSKELQEEMEKMKEHHDGFKKDINEKASKLGEEAKKVFDKIKVTKSSRNKIKTGINNNNIPYFRPSWITTRSLLNKITNRSVQ